MYRGKFAVHGWPQSSQKWFNFCLRTERRASTIACGRTMKQSLSQENALWSSVRRRYEQGNCMRKPILDNYLYVSRINHFKHRLLPALLSNIAGCSANITYIYRCVCRSLLLSLATLTSWYSSSKFGDADSLIGMLLSQSTVVIS